jgi:uncharacterized protein
MIFRRAARGTAGLLAALVILFAAAGSLRAQPANLPPKPDRYITDNANVLDGATLDTINSQLDQFERTTSNQIVVAIYPSLPPQTDIAQYATYTYNAWQIGQKGKDNGALLLIDVNDRQMFIATGRGLEGALPDAICKNIITDVIAPRFKQGDYAGGIQAGVNAMISATKGEYTGNGSTVADSHGGQQLPTWLIILIIIIFVIIISNSRGGGFGGPIIYSSGGWGGGGGFGGGGGGGFGGGGFSGGGGSSAGGGAGGGW